MTKLKRLDLSDNQLDGDIPAFISNMTSLQYIDLSKNLLRGHIPLFLGHMTSLRNLDLSSNRLQGVIPLSAISNLTFLEHIDISYNQFHGLFPFSIFANLSQLSVVDISDNSQLEVDTESPTWVPSFQLIVLGLGNCNLNSHSGHRIPKFLSSQYALKDLYLIENSLVGRIPSWSLYNASIEILILNENNLTGPFPQPNYLNKSTTSQINILELFDNPIYSSLPENIGNLFPKLQELIIFRSGLQGRIPASLGELKALESLELYENYLSGEIPNSFSKNGSSLLALNLSHNKLHGNIFPAGGANFTRLGLLCLNNNNFSGTMEAGLEYLQYSLVYVDLRNNYLTGNISTHLPVLPRLKFLLLGSNQFEGKIPTQLCHMQKLRFIDLSNNQLTGAIPSCLNNISAFKDDSSVYLIGRGFTFDLVTKGNTYEYSTFPLMLMSGIDLSGNKITGNVPRQMGFLRVLRSLNLSNNLLTGQIPASFQYLRSLESLDLSTNRLAGKIPPGLVKLQFLSFINVSFNSLAGEIPTEGQFFSFDMSSFLGNPGLCGQVLNKNCTDHGILDPPGSHEEGDEEDGIVDSPMFFYGFVACSFILGFWGIMGFLILNKTWRISYLRAMDRFIEFCSENISGFYMYLKNHYFCK